jgi:dTMP kinase
MDDYYPYIREPHAGTLIVMDGCDGSGKTTFAKILQEKLQEQFKQNLVKYYREPGGTPTSEMIRKICVNMPTCKETELLVFMAARMELIHEIKPYLNAGHIIILDRYIDSTYVYQGLLRGFGIDFITKIHSLFPIPKPDIRIFLDVDPVIAEHRKNDQNEIQKFEKLQKAADIREYYKAIYFSIFAEEYADSLISLNTDSGNKELLFEQLFKSVIDKIEMRI